VSQIEDKKKRDLENLKRHNELILQLQREKLAAEEQFQETLLGLQHALDEAEVRVKEVSSELARQVTENNTWKSEVDKLNLHIESLKAGLSAGSVAGKGGVGMAAVAAADESPTTASFIMVDGLHSSSQHSPETSLQLQNQYKVIIDTLHNYSILYL
jgi:chromosome segregation ATPase